MSKLVQIGLNLLELVWNCVNLLKLFKSYQICRNLSEICQNSLSSWCSYDRIVHMAVHIIIEGKILWNHRKKVLLCYFINYLFSLHSAEVNWMGFLQPSEKIEPGRCFSLPNYGDTKEPQENYSNTILVSKKLKRAFKVPSMYVI